MREKTYVSIGGGTILAETERAIFFRGDETGEESWIPRSQIEDGEDLTAAEYIDDLYITEWWRDEKL